MKYWPAIVALGVLAGCVRFHPQPLSPAETAARLECRSLGNPDLRTFLETNLHRELNTWPARKWDFDMLTLAAFYYQPSLEVARASWRVTTGGIQTAAERPNPTATWSLAYEPASDAYSPWIPGLIFDLPIETAGKRRFRTEQARHLSDSARLNIATTAWQVRSQLRVSVIDYVSAARREALLRQELSVQEQVVASLEQRREAGALAAAEITPARLLLQKVRVDLNDAQRLQAEARARVAEAIGVPVSALKEVDVAYDLTALPADADRLTSSEVRRQALQHRADVLAGLSDYAASESALQLEVAKQYPDIHLAPGYMWNAGSTGESDWQIGATVELPVLNRHRGPIAEAEARRQESAARFKALQARVIADLDRSLAVYQVAARTRASAEALLATQRRQEESIVQQFQAGAVDRLDVLTARVELATSELALADNQAKLHLAFGALEDTVQLPLAFWPKLEQSPTATAQKEIP